MRRRPFLRSLATLLLGAGSLAALAACGGDAAPALQVQRDTVGDTVIVRTVAGSAWDADARLEPELRIGTFDGEDVYMLGDVAGLAVAPDGAVYVYDRQVPALRKYGPDGRYIATFGREGGGPGEYKNSDGGMAVLQDGRVLLRDPGNGRITVYAPDGELLATWPLRGGYFTSQPLYVDTAGTVYTQIWGRRGEERYSALRPFHPDGTVGDSLMVPEWEYEEAGISVQTDRIAMMRSVPFAPQPHWSFSPHGYLVGGFSGRYAIDLFHPDGTVLRIGREIEPVRVSAAEKDAKRMGVIRNFQQLVPDWQWNGPGIPDTKPLFQDIAVGRDGRIWVRLHQPGFLDEPADPQDPMATDQWTEPTVWDVFDPDGTYLGQVHAPEGFAVHPEPVFGSDHVWAITTDELDVEYLTRFRIVHGPLDRGVGTE
jgi:hypothetical protein